MLEDKNNQFTDDAIRRFLLGRLDAAEQSTFEEQLFADDRLEALVRLGEFDLTDDYALARLSSEDREAFEQKFLLSDGRKRRLNVSNTLRDRFSSASNAAIAERDGAKASVAERLRLLFGLDRRSWRLAFGVLIAAVLIGTVWLVVKQPRIKENIKAIIFNRRAPAPLPSVPRLAAHPGNRSSAPVHQTTPSPMPPHEPTASPATIVLFPGATRDDLPVINLPKGEHDIVRLQLALKPNQIGSYRAELLTIDGQSVFSSESLQATDTDARRVEFDVPASLLKVGDYRVSLRRADDASKRIVASYYLRVQ